MCSGTCPPSQRGLCCCRSVTTVAMIFSQKHMDWGGFWVYIFYKVPLALGPTKRGYYQSFSLAIVVSLVTTIHFRHSWDGPKPPRGLLPTHHWQSTEMSWDVPFYSGFLKPLSQHWNLLLFAGGQFILRVKTVFRCVGSCSTVGSILWGQVFHGWRGVFCWILTSSMVGSFSP